MILLRFSYLDCEFGTHATVNHHTNENCSVVAKQIVLFTNFEFLLKTHMKNEKERVTLIQSYLSDTPLCAAGNAIHLHQSKASFVSQESQH